MRPSWKKLSNNNDLRKKIFSYLKIAICNTQSDVLEKDPQIVSRASQYLKNPEYRRAFEAGNISQLPDNVRYDLDIMDHLFYLDGIKKLDVYSPLRQEVDPMLANSILGKFPIKV